MLEHIFRNMDDIRIFDLMTEFPEKDIPEKEIVEDNLSLGVVDINDIIDMLDYGEYKRIEVEDSIDHLVRSQILCIKKIRIEGKTGCRICKWTDKLKLPRIGDHKSHKPEEISVGEVNNFCMKDNELTQLLRAAAFKHVMMMLDDEIEKEEIEKDKIEKDNIEEGKTEKDK